MNFHDEIDERVEARQERSAIWAAACQRKISTERLYERLAALRARWGDALYERPSRR